VIHARVRVIFNPVRGASLVELDANQHRVIKNSTFLTVIRYQIRNQIDFVANNAQLLHQTPTNQKK
jgi:hypothetical protein